MTETGYNGLAVIDDENSPFYGLDETLSPKTAKRIVEQHGHKVYSDNETGRLYVSEDRYDESGRYIGSDDFILPLETEGLAAWLGY